MTKTIAQKIKSGNTSLGIELGSTRIKAVLIDDTFEVIADGGYTWENQWIDGYWTYSLDEVWEGIQYAYKALAEKVKITYGETLSCIGSIGISAMMHGYLPFDNKDELLVAFRTWRNTKQEEASQSLTNLFNYPIPQRWSIAHLYQAILNDEDHVQDIAYLTTLSGYIHWQLTGEKVMGIGEASGMFPIHLETKSFNKNMMKTFDQLEKNVAWKLDEIMPKVLVAGEEAGALSIKGARLIDPSGNLNANIPLCPPEGDAGTGMVATNSIKAKTGNVSAGTSVFAMIVLEKDLTKVYSELDQVTTPEGNLVAMAHANNCSSDLDAWIQLLGESAKLLGATFDNNHLYETMFKSALDADDNIGNLMSYGYLSGEHITNVEEGRPLFVRQPNSQLNLANFMCCHLYSALGALRIGLDILLTEEKVQLDSLLGHGGYFKTEGVGQRMMAAAVGVPVSVMPTAAEGGAWGIAILASYLLNNECSLVEFLDKRVFESIEINTYIPLEYEINRVKDYMMKYKEGQDLERLAHNFV